LDLSGGNEGNGGGQLTTISFQEQNFFQLKAPYLIWEAAQATLAAPLFGSGDERSPAALGLTEASDA